MELRNYFSLYCLHQEMQLVHTYLPLTSHILGAFVNSQIQGHKEVGPLVPPPSPRAPLSALPLLQAWQPSQATLKNDLGKLVELG